MLRLSCQPIFAQRKLPNFYHSQSSNESLYHDHPQKVHCHLYFETFHNIINCIKDRFNQTDYQIYVHIQEIFIKAFKEQDGEDDLQIVMQNYVASELDVHSLKTQLLLPEIAKFCGLDSRMQLSEMIAFFQKLYIIKRMLVAEVIKLVKVISVMPATNAVTQRLFLFLKRIKTYLPSTTANNWLNHLLILHIHKLLTDRLDLTNVADEFVEKREGRESKFVL